jgi:hypothetical protein
MISGNESSRICRERRPTSGIWLSSTAKLLTIMYLGI